MAYKFLDVIQDIKTNLSYEADKAEQELKDIDARQTKLQEELSARKPRHLRAHSLESRDDLICAHCFILHNIESPLTTIPGSGEIDRFRCKKCKAEYELNVW